MIGPLLAGWVTLGVTFVVPPTYESRSVLKLDESATALLASDDLMAPLLPKATWIEKDALLSVRLQKLRDDVKSSYNKKTKLSLFRSADPAPRSPSNFTTLLSTNCASKCCPKALSFPPESAMEGRDRTPVDQHQHGALVR